MAKYCDEDMLMLSGIQHFCFCRRQWALIHIEQAWAENKLTVEGDHLHKKVDDPLSHIKRKDLITLNSVHLASYELGLYGISDIIELHKSNNSENSIIYPRFEGYWKIIPIEYKRGSPKCDERDQVQLCAQALCLEEMYNVFIPIGYLYYGETRHREIVEFSPKLREHVSELSKNMHEIFKSGITPLAIAKNHCKNCSLVDICLPNNFTSPKKVSTYLKQLIDN